MIARPESRLSCQLPARCSDFGKSCKVMSGFEYSGIVVITSTPSFAAPRGFYGRVGVGPDRIVERPGRRVALRLLGVPAWQRDRVFVRDSRIHAARPGTAK